MELDDFETTMNKTDLLEELTTRLKKLKVEKARLTRVQDKAMKAWRLKAGNILAKAAMDMRTGKLRPGFRSGTDIEGTWCRVKYRIEQAIGSPPELLETVDYRISKFEAAIHQIQHSRTKEGVMRVNTRHIETWLKGETIERRRR